MPSFAFAQSAPDTSVGADVLSREVKDRQAKINDLNSMIENYKKKISEQDSSAVSLQNQVLLLENRAQEKQLAIERTKNEIGLATAEIQTLDQKIAAQSEDIAHKQEALGELVRRLREADQVNPLYVFLTKPSFSEFFARLDEVKQVEESVVDTTLLLKNGKKYLDVSRRERETQRLALVQEQKTLEKEQIALEMERGAKTSLVAATQDKEGEFRRILYELRQQHQEELDRISSVQDKLKDALNRADDALAHGDTVLQLPLPALKGISATFHDPSYPFRKLFEHPGIDIPTKVGTPVHAAAGGYIAWTRTGTQYGNYIMIVHPGGLATVYAHLSRFGVKADTYVERGDVIGYSGGRPGDQGAGLSTGPHLHFEVRQNGIPVNPENFLPEI